MASVDERKETSLRACIAHMLDIDVSEVPKKRETNMGQWLALRNLGLVPVASPESFGGLGAFLVSAATHRPGRSFSVCHPASSTIL